LFYGNTAPMPIGNKYYQATLQNIDPVGAGAFTVVADDGNDASNWLSVGITNSEYSDPLFPTSLPHDGFLSVNGGNLNISVLTDSLYFNTNVLGAIKTTSVLPDGTWVFNGNLLPAANVTYGLGNESNQWKDLWVSSNTIYVGNTPIQVQGDTLLVNGAPVGSSTSVFISDTPPVNGTLWFNSTDARTYVKYNNQWVDASPTILPEPDTNPTLESVTFNDATVQTTAWTGTVSYNNVTDKPAFVGGGSASTWLTAN
jgi:hypothetical protein